MKGDGGAHPSPFAAGKGEGWIEFKIFLAVFSVHLDLALSLALRLFTILYGKCLAIRHAGCMKYMQRS